MVINFKKKTLLLLCILVSCTITILSSIIYIRIKSVLRYEKTISSQNSINQLSNTMEIVLTESDRILYQVAFGKDIENYAENYDNLNYKEHRKLKYQINSILSANIYFRQCYVYYPEDNKVYDSSLMLLLDENKYKNLEFIKNIYNEFQKEDKLKPLNMYYTDYEGERILTLVKPVTITSKHPKAFLIVELSPKFIKEALEKIIIKEGSSFVIFDDRDEIIAYRSKDKDENYISYILSNMENDSGTIIDNKGYKNLAIFARSETLGWNFLSLTSIDNLYGTIYNIRNFIFILSTIFLGIAVICSISLAKLFYRPINRIKSVLNIEDDVCNEVEGIVNNIEEIKENNKSLELLAEESKPLVKYSILTSVLENTMHLDNIVDRLNYYEFKFKYDKFFCVVVISLDSIETIRQKYTEKQINLFHIYIKNNINAFFSEYNFHIEFLDRDLEYLIAILNFEEDQIDNLNTLIRKMHLNIFNNLSQSVTIGVGVVEKRIENISVSYKTAMKSIEQRIFQGKNQVIFYDDLFSNEYLNFELIYDLEDVICKCLKQSNSSKIVEATNRYFEYLCSNTNDFNKLKFSLIHLYVSIIKTLSELTVPVESILDNQENAYIFLYGIETVDIAREWFDTFIGNIIEYMEHKKNDKTKEIYTKVEQYIDENYIKQDLGLEYIADELHFSVSYLSKIFKEFKGITIKAYLSQKRIEYAKELLIKSDYKIKQIAEKSGYTNDRAFISNFKKYIGVTPGAYRNTNQKDI